MNNKGFAITVILYGLLILFCLLMVSLLGILSTYRGNLEKLIENSNGSRDIVTMKCIDYKLDDGTLGTFDDLKNSGNGKRGLYKFRDETSCKYVSSGDLK